MAKLITWVVLRLSLVSLEKLTFGCICHGELKTILFKEKNDDSSQV
jgi:hypothetical protein